MVNPNRTLTLQNRQRTRVVNLRVLRRLAEKLLHDLLPAAGFDLSVYLVAAPEMIRLNETFLHHKGSTDVITFDYAETARSVPAFLHGEIFICLDEAIAQARRFHATWQSELARYLIHGLLHLQGFDDQQPSHRRRMRRAETRFLRRLAARTNLTELGRTVSSR